MSKTSLTPAELAALAASVGTTAADPAATGTTTESGTVTEVTQHAEKEVVATQAKVELLTAQLATKDTELTQVRVDLAQAKSAAAPLEAQLAAATTSIKSLSAIVAASVTNMKVALGGSATDLSALSPEQLLAEHTASAEAFRTKFKAGGVAAVPAAETAKGAAMPDARHMALINATRFTTK